MKAGLLPTEDDVPRAHRSQSIAHRGYKAKYPENTMCAFRHAIKADAQALETDIHLSKDGVVVLSHDPTLKRCFGINKRVIDCDWEYLSTLRTLQAPHEPMATLVQLLEYLAVPENTGIWVLLDIKIDNDREQVMRAIADAIRSVPSPHQPWEERIILGCWTSDYLPLCSTYLPSFSIAIITFSIKYARLFLRFPNIAISINQKVLMGPGGKKLLADAKRAQQPVFVWTVNEENLMRWSIEQGVDGVITDDPDLFRQVRDEWDAELESDGDLKKPVAGCTVKITLRQKIAALVVSAAAYLISDLLMLVFRARIRRFVEESRHHRGGETLN
ncbi:hypothetical protein VTO42DRAFT_7139 [Malbranchea cinnamomea]